jgi:predicted nucleotidyltransferase
MHLHIDPAALRRFCETHHVRQLSLFGSQLKGNAGPDSDVDFLVEFEPEHIPGLPNLPWKATIGMRNRLIHAYFDIDAGAILHRRRSASDKPQQLLPVGSRQSAC